MRRTTPSATSLNRAVRSAAATVLCLVGLTSLAGAAGATSPSVQTYYAFPGGQGTFANSDQDCTVSMMSTADCSLADALSAAQLYLTNNPGGAADVQLEFAGSANVFSGSDLPTIGRFHLQGGSLTIAAISSLDGPPRIIGTSGSGNFLSFVDSTATPTTTSTSSLTVSGITFQGFSSLTRGGVMHLTYIGSASFTNDRFSENYSDVDGGAIYDEGTYQSSLTLTSDTFSFNGALGNGGAVAVDMAPVGVASSTSVTTTDDNFLNNSAVGSGGALAQSISGDGLYDTLTDAGSSFSNNSATGNGGAVDIADQSSSANLVLDGTSFYGNSATGNGGAVDAGDHLSQNDASLTNTEFSLNSAMGDGGAIDDIDNGGNGLLTDSGSQYNTNTAGLDGGAIDAGDNGGTSTVTLSSDGFQVLSGQNPQTSQNYTVGNQAGLDGGALDVGDNNGFGSVTMTGGQFINSSANDEGGAIDAGDHVGIGDLHITSTGFFSNAATIGGAIMGGEDDGVSHLQILDSLFRSNDASGPGALGGAVAAGLYGGAAVLTLTSDQFTSNDVTGSGGSGGSGGAIACGEQSVALGSSDCAATITASSFSENVASEFGGAAQFGDGGSSYATVTFSTFIQNTAGSGGAAISNGTVTTDPLANTAGDTTTIVLLRSTFYDKASGSELLNADSSANSHQVGGSLIVGACPGFTDGGYNAMSSTSCPITQGSSVLTSISFSLGDLAATSTGEQILMVDTSAAYAATIPTGSSQWLCQSQNTDETGAWFSDNCTIGAVNTVLETQTLYAVPAGAAVDTTGSSGCTLISDDCSLQAAIDAAQNLPVETHTTIMLESHAYSLVYADGPYTINGDSAHITIERDPSYSSSSGPVIFQGSNYAGTSIFTITGASGYVAFSNVEFTGANSGHNGGAIDASSFSGALVLSNDSFLGNSAYANGGAVDLADGSAMAGSLVISSTTFSQNSAVNNGGAIDAGDNGGTVWTEVTNSTFSDNSANENNIALTLSAGDGGAIDVADGESTWANLQGSGITSISGSTFVHNTAYNCGGALDLGDKGTSKAHIQTSQFSVNRAQTGSGGAINSGDGPQGPTSLQVQQSSFNRNSSGDFGGAIASADAHGTSPVTAYLALDTFYENVTIPFASNGLAGGAVSNGSYGGVGTMTIVWDTFIDNGNEQQGSPVRGSSIFSGSTGTTLIERSTIDQGSAIDPALYAKAQVTVVGSLFLGGNAPLCTTDGGLGTITSLGYNYEQDDPSCGFSPTDGATGDVSDAAVTMSAPVQGTWGIVEAPDNSNTLDAAIPVGMTVPYNNATITLCAASDTDGNGSETVSACTPGSIDVAPRVHSVQSTAPDMPTGLKVATKGSNRLVVSWNAVTDNGSGPITGYLCSAPGLASVTATGTSCNLTGVNLYQSGSYTVSVQAVAGGVTSDPANITVRVTGSSVPTTTTPAPVKKTLVCTMGHNVKRVTGTAPKCPAGYKKA